MGEDKATLLFRGKPLWQIQLELLRKFGPAEILVSARTDPAWRPDDIRFIADIPPSRGPLSGLVASLAKIRTTHLLALAIDMPLMTEDYLRSLCHHIEPGRGVVPKTTHGVEPLAAIYPREADIELKEALKGTDFSLQTLVRRQIESRTLREISVSEQEQRLFLNVNELSDIPVV
jgi:molybdopterin-guanine dinucleotide biosynthesis protein A